MTNKNYEFGEFDFVFANGQFSKETVYEIIKNEIAYNAIERHDDCSSYVAVDNTLKRILHKVGDLSTNE